MAFPASSPLVGLISKLDFLAAAKNSGSFMVSMKDVWRIFTRSFGVPGGTA